jgi:hypothetical protein
MLPATAIADWISAYSPLAGISRLLDEGIFIDAPVPQLALKFTHV